MKGKTIGNYEIIEEIGEGGMGIVYKARQARLDRIVALKVLLPNLSKKKDFVERFMREARNAARLEHPNIVTIHEVGQDGDTHYFSMNYIEGRDIDDILSGGPFSLSDAIDIVSQVASGLDHAHKKGVIHRDIKPANIIVDESGRAVITDFGIARAAWEEKLTTTGAAMGTIEYMSPEQFKGGAEPDARSDIYALGATLYRMVVGSSPFPGQTTHEVMYKKFNERPPLPTSANPSLPEWIDTVIEKVMAEEPESRYGSAIEFVNALRKGLGEAPVRPAAAPPVKEGAPSQKTVLMGAKEGKRPVVSWPPEKKRKAVIAVICAAIGIGVIVIIVGVIQLFGPKKPAPYGGGGLPAGGPAGPPPQVQPMSEPEPIAPPPPRVEYGYITANRVNMRSGPGLTYGVIRELNQGEGVTIFDRTSTSTSNECTLTDRSTVYLEGGGSITLSSGHGMTILGESGGSYRVQFTVKGRSQPYYGYVDKYYVRLIGGDYWYNVRLDNGQEGWVLDDYVSIR